MTQACLDHYHPKILAHFTQDIGTMGLESQLAEKHTLLLCVYCQQARSFQLEIQQQMKRRQAEAELKKQRAQSSRYQQRHTSDDEADKANSSDDEYAHRQVNKKRKKPSFI